MNLLLYFLDIMGQAIFDYNKWLILLFMTPLSGRNYYFYDGKHMFFYCPTFFTVRTIDLITISRFLTFFDFFPMYLFLYNYFTIEGHSSDKNLLVCHIHIADLNSRILIPNFSFFSWAQFHQCSTPSFCADRLTPVKYKPKI